jgi:tRNA dimethylallyltransferase
VKTLVVILGPTASGKTGLAIDLAKKLDTEIISADSRQFYREIPIGTAAPKAGQLQSVHHHFVGQLSISDDYNVSKYEQDVLALLEEKFKSLDTVIMVGGSGLYIDAVCNGIDDLPDPDEKLRSHLNDLFEKEGIGALQLKLKELDPLFYSQVDLNNPKRLLRAIEVCLQTGKPYSALRKQTRKTRDFNILKIGLEIPRDELYTRINRRTDEMMKRKWLEEAQSVYSQKHLNSLNTVGYKELFKYFDGDWDLETAIEKIKTNTRRYAKRQMTWFKKDTEIHWFHPGEREKIFSFVSSYNNQV